MRVVTAADRSEARQIEELAEQLRPPLLRVTRLLRIQRHDTSVTLAELSAMNQLARFGPMSIGELAASERVRPPTMTRLVAELERRSLLRRRAREVDKRQAILELTEAGTELLSFETKARDAWLTGRLARLTPAQRRTLFEVVPILYELAEDGDD